MKNKQKENSSAIKADKTRDQDFKNLYKRALADYQNLVKQTAREKEDFVRYLKGNLIMEFIPIYENLKNAVEHADGESHDKWLKGVQYVIKQFEDVLANNGVQIIDPAGGKFDPAEHEAVEKTETEDKKQANKVAKVVKQGYKMSDKVIQAAKVAVYTLKDNKDIG